MKEIQKPEQERSYAGWRKRDVVCTRCGHNNVNQRGECRQCIDWQKHQCTFPVS
jgi:hypothetical protein